MSRFSRAAELGLDAITIEGGLIAPEQVQKIAAASSTAKLAASYDCPRGTSLNDEVARYFRIGQALWSDYERIEQKTVTHTAQFVHDLLSQCFGFDDLTGPVDHVEGNRRYRLAWEARAGRVPVVVAPPAIGREPFNLSAPEFGDGTGGGRLKRSPVSLLQDWLNSADQALWGLVFAGDKVRLMRDNASLTRPAWIEADLGAIFREEMFADFTAWWLLTHATRFGAAGAPTSDCALEEWRAEGLKQGETARADLYKNVRQALAELGQGAVEANPDLRKRLVDKTELTAFFEELLRTAYRLIFLAVAEDRDLLHPGRISQEARALYRDSYSFGFWRERARRRVARDTHHDAWEAMKITIANLEHGQELLGLPALGGLFAAGATPMMNEAKISNRRFLTALFHLGFIMRNGATHRINWRDLKTEELGSVYEGLLEITPQLGTNEVFDLDDSARGNARKTSGSYYTPDSLVEKLLDSALDPLLKKAEYEAETPERKIAAIFDLKVIDPACGSGHFLLGAARRIADRVAKLRNEDAGKQETQVALRDVVSRCIYGVDRNPLAVELAKVALWIESVSPGKPLGFLDGNIRCGDALLGVFDLEALEQGIPDEAYKPLAGDNQDTAKHYLKVNRDAKAGQGVFDFAGGGGAMPPAKLAANLSLIRRMPEDTVNQVDKKREAYAAWRDDPARQATHVACDLYMAAFLLPKTEVPSGFGSGLVPTTADVRLQLAGQQINSKLYAATREVSKAARLLHWPLAFPDVMIERGGFDVVLGNPPWDAMSPDVKEFFSAYEPEIRFMSPNDQKQRLDELLESDELATAWEEEKSRLYRTANFLRNSERFTLFAEGNLGKGDFNVYRMFVEFAFRGVRPGGVAAQIVPENFYNGANAAALRQFVFDQMNLLTLVTFENTRQVWFDIDSRQKFCLYASASGGTTTTIPAAFGINSEAKLADLPETLPFQIPLSFVRELSPAALAVPEFADPRDVAIARKAHARLPSFGAAIAGANDRIYMREIDMGNDRDFFGEDVDGLPLFEGRMVEAFDYRAKEYVSGRGRQAVWKELPFGEPGKRIAPQWHIPLAEVPEKTVDRTKSYRIGFCGIGGVTNQRFLMAAMIPPASLCGHSVPTIMFEPNDDRLHLFWLGLANSLCLDFLARQKGALNVTLTLVDSLPLPRRYTGSAVEQAIVARAARLSCSGREMAALWARLPSSLVDLPPADDPETRRLLRAELDVLVARDFFGLTRDEMRYLLDPSSVLGPDCGIETFGALKRAETRNGQPFTSFNLIMEAWDALDVPR
ncbi:type II DNA modification enzyme [Pseudomonas aeruginosa]|uniref:Eco57I restriction-modification methylase domain-containing protein n=1 Tax=Pseudomonas aeruginosa TaxID=287 RepID=UPI000B9A31D1|nr:N-6 DNA methylase [Pseudomonas aeruginosa]OXT66077.1 type II DNA modification enzyme [Pseudomonas aeruginosa]